MVYQALANDLVFSAILMSAGAHRGRHQTFDILIVALSRIVQRATTRQRPAKTAQCGRKTPQRHNPDNAGLKMHHADDGALLPRLGGLSQSKSFLIRESPPSLHPIPHALAKFHTRCQAHHRRQKFIYHAKMRKNAGMRQSKCQKTDVLVRLANNSLDAGTDATPSGRRLSNGITTSQKSS
jgi:hypothetical protein